ncbi:MAG: primosomal protein N' [Pseudomonadales bacterium]|nr:primosomal protein N' [Pseudomonadales bacterium]MBL6816693.1 primosomal protein N' [Pseudomonadales bacterium]
MTSTNSVIRVAVPTPLRRAFDYLPIADLPTPKVGTRVRVPFGRREVIAVVIQGTAESALADKQLKAALEYLETEPVLPDNLFRALIWASEYYQHPVGDVFATAIPKLLRSGAPTLETREVLRATVAPDPDQLTALRRAPKQQQLHAFIESNGQVSADQIKQAGYSLSLARQLEHKQLVERAEITAVDSVSLAQTDKPGSAPLRLNNSQQDAVDVINASSEFHCYLLDGVTGSGKTEVYMQAMAKVLDAGAQCLLLVPEIGLTPQNLSRFESRFSCPIVTLHSGMTDRERLRAWRIARSGEAGIVIGTRSAIFTPLASPGLIIIDEEHDSSFKQQDGLRYSARDFGIKRAQLESMPIVLGSATPSLESLNNAIAGRFTHLKLTARAGNASKPRLILSDISASQLDEGLSQELLIKIDKHLQQGNQVLLFINRRGFAPVLQCQQCGWASECTNCNARLTVHAKPPVLRCHHCEARAPIPRACPDCQSRNLATLGAGTQKLEAFLKARFTQTPVLRIDRDSTRGKRAFEALFDRINQGESCLLLGTQMLAKGHHFPDVTLVAVLDADIGLFSPDFRGQEHMAQTIVQVAGRAGRAEKPGEVVIQTRHSEHPALVNLVNASYEDYARDLLQERAQSKMPPFAHLALLRIESTFLDRGFNFARACLTQASALQTDFAEIELIGPLPAPLEKKAGRHRFQLYIKSASRPILLRYLQQFTQALERIKSPAQTRWSLDVDPLDLI